MTLIFEASDFLYFEDIINSFDSLGHNIILIDPVPSDDSLKNDYLNGLICLVKESNPDFIMSLDFKPFLSLAAGAMNLKYVSWIISAFSASTYDLNIKNDFNYIFCQDSYLTSELKKYGVKHCAYLPLAIPDLSKMSKSNNEVRLNLFGSIDSTFTYLGANDYKDSTKGYLDGALGCSFQLENITSFYSRLPNYVQTDWEAKTNFDSSKTFEEKSAHFDHNYFNPFLTNSARAAHFTNISQFENFSPITYYGQQYDAFDKKIKTDSNYYNPITLASYCQNSINVCITNRNRVSGVSPIIWTILGSGGILLTSIRKDWELFEGSEKLLFNTHKELIEKLKQINEDDSDYRLLMERIKNEALQKHTFSLRIQQIINNIQVG